MTKHLTPCELDFIVALNTQGKTLTDIQKRLASKRKGAATPSINNLRRALKGKVYKRSLREARGRPRKISTAKLRLLNTVRKSLQKQSKGLREVTLQRLRMTARLRVHPATLSRALGRLGIKWRSPRVKPSRTTQQDQLRLQWCSAKRRLPEQFWESGVDMYIDCKKFALPLSARPREAIARMRVRGAFRTRGEGLRNHMTKPCPKKHNVFPGATAWVLGGVCGDKIVLWEYIPGRWNAEVASNMYSTAIQAALKKHRPGRRFWTICEDNDPAGFKSGRAVAMKRSLKIRPLSLPPYSPDLQPLDYSLWAEVERRARAVVGDQSVTAAKYRKVLRQAALRLPRPVVSAAVRCMKARVQAVFEAKGGHIAND